MSRSTSHTPGQLTSTLILALTQSEDQCRTIQDQAARIDRLQRENERLRQAVDHDKQTEQFTLREEVERTQEDLQSAHTRIEELEHHEQENAQLRQELDQLKQNHAGGQQSSQALDDLFQKQVEAQAEIHKLRKKLKRYKEKANGRLPEPISSPVSYLSTPELTSPRPVQHAPNAMQDAILVTSSPPRKRQRTEPEPLQEAPVNTSHLRKSLAASKKGLDKKIAAIPLLTEDGDEHVPANSLQDPPRATLQRNGSWQERLNGLLDSPTPDRAPLHRLRPGSSGSILPRPKSFAISNIQHDYEAHSEAPTARSLSRTSTPQRAQHIITNSTRSSINRSIQRPPVDKRPLRSRPPEELFIHNFKPSPRWMVDHQMSIGDYLHGRNGERLRAIASTLPHMPGPQMSDDELLLWFMGPGNEEKIANLTTVAKKNLLAEAKIKRVAEKFGKQRLDYDRDNDAPGMWNIDFPATQEEEENRRKAQEKERAEVLERYGEAMSGHGKWVFADEVDAT